MSGHAKLAPSSAARRVACPGSRALEARFPADDSPEAREGTAAHWVASYMLIGIYQGEAYAPNGEEVTGEMIEGAKLYTETILPVVRAPANKPIAYQVEQRVDISTIHPDCWGTPDAWYYADGELHIWDYKYGHGFVEVFENWQLIEYAAGILEHLRTSVFNANCVSVTFCIIQPRSFHRDGFVRQWKIGVDRLQTYFDVLRRKESLAAQEIAPCTPSPECTYCLARSACTALQRSALCAVDLSSGNAPHILNSHQTGNELRVLLHAAALLDARITGLTEQASAMIKRGELVPHFALEQSYGRQKWDSDAATIFALGDLYGIDLRKPQEPITPKQAIKLGLDETLVEGFTETPPGAVKLVPHNAKKIFGGGK